MIVLCFNCLCFKSCIGKPVHLSNLLFMLPKLFYTVSTVLLTLFLALSVSISNAQPLQGVYVIGSGTADYEEIYDAVYDLQYNGVSGPVVFEIKTGVYNEYISLSPFTGSSRVNTVTFRSQTGNAQDVVWRDNHYSGHNHTLRLAGADNIIIENLTIECYPEDASDNEYSRVLMFQSEANNIIVRNSIIRSFNVGYMGNYHNDCIYVNSNTNNQHFCDSISFINNVIIGGYGGLAFAGVASPEEFGATNLTIKDNVFVDQRNRSLEVVGVRNCSITGNRFYSTEQDMEGMVVRYVSDSLLMSGNYLHLFSGGKGITLENLNADGEENLVVSNNVVSVGADPNGGASVGFSTVNNDSLLIAYNSVNINSDSTNSFAIHSSGTDTLMLINNQLVTNPGGYCYYSDQNDPVFTQDYNNAFSGSATLAQYNMVDHDLAALQTTFQSELNSTSIDPAFLSTTLLMPTVAAVNNTGLPLTSITTDHLGNARSAIAPDVGAYESAVGLLDAAIQVATFVSDTVCADDTIQLTVNLINLGSVQLTTAALAYGTPDSVYGTYNWNGSLNQYEFENSIYLGDLPIRELEQGNFAIWVADQNNSIDQLTLNDTASIHTSIRMSGTYTIGGPTGDFATISDAIDALTTKGICGPVVFDIADGVYHDQMYMQEIFGSSSINTITFQSASLDSSAVEIKYQNGPYAQYLWKLDGTDNIRFRHLTFHPYGSWPDGFVLEGSIENIEFTNNRIYGEEYDGYFIKTDGYTSITNLLIQNNRFEDGGGSVAVNIYAGGQMNFKDNIFTGFYGIPIGLTGASDVIISGNKMYGLGSNSNSSTCGIALSDCDAPILIERNDIIRESSGYRINLDNCVGTLSDPILIRNNFLGNPVTTNPGKGIWFRSYSEHIKVLNNSLKCEWAIDVGHQVTNLQVTNNILYNPLQTEVYNLRAADPSTVGLDIDYNAVYTNDTALAQIDFDYTLTFPEWQNQFGFDEHGIVTIPLYVDSVDMHIVNQFDLNGTGTPLAEVVEDIDGELRDLTMPDIGADEFDIDSTAYYDIELVKVLSPDTASCSEAHEIILQVASHSNFPITEFTTKWWLFGILNDSTVQAETIQPYDTVEVNLGSFNFTPNTLYRLDFELSFPNGELDSHFNDNEAHIDHSYLGGVTIHQYKDSLCTSQVELYITSFPRATTLWSDGSTEKRIYATQGTFTVTVEDSDGCSVTDTHTID